MHWGFVENQENLIALYEHNWKSGKLSGFPDFHIHGQVKRSGLSCALFLNCALSIFDYNDIDNTTRETKD